MRELDDDTMARTQGQFPEGFSDPVGSAAGRAVATVPPAVLSYIIFFFSGLAGLVYEVSWSRQIGLLFGHTVHAAAIVLAAYFAGMSLGYLIGAKWSSRIAPLLGYSIAEVLVATWACLIPILLKCSESHTLALWLSSSSFGYQTALRAASCFLLLLPATVALGVTLPMMAESLTTRCGSLTDSTIAGRVSLAYSLNTTGALLGVLSATYFLLVVVGVQSSSYLAAGVSTGCAIAAFAMRNSRRGRQEAPIKQIQHRELALSSDSSSSQLLCYSLAALSGFGILALEVLYTRMFSLVLHNSTYTFGAVIAVFLASLAAGAAITSHFQRRYSVESLVGWAMGLGALATILSVLVFVLLTDLDYYTYGDSFIQYLGGAFLLVVLVVAPPILLLGMVLPLVWKAAGRGVSVGSVVGRITAVNAAASTAGALGASFLLLPGIGLWPAFIVISALFYAIAFVLLVRDNQSRTAFGGAVLLGGLMLFVLNCPIESNYGRAHYGEQIVHRWNSPYGWIDLVRLEKTGSLKVRHNLHYRFGETGDNVREFRQAHIPLLLHERPKDVLFLGLGTGLTAGAAIPHNEVNSIVAVELVAEVVEAARWLAQHNYGVVDHAKVHVHVDDARHYLLATTRRFDVIISDLFIPWESESGYLYTVEHYQLASNSLNPGGLFCQWLPLYQVGTREFELIADSFASVFPVTTIWWGEMDTKQPVIALIGSNSPLQLDFEKLATRLVALRKNTKSTDEDLSSPKRFFNAYQGDWLRRQTSFLNTDEHPRIEFLTPISNRDFKLIEGSILLNYYDQVLATLPSNHARLQGDVELGTEALEQRRAGRRFILFGEAIP